MGRGSADLALQCDYDALKLNGLRRDKHGLHGGVGWAQFDHVPMTVIAFDGCFVVDQGNHNVAL